jgi:hypothetical protein
MLFIRRICADPRRLSVSILFRIPAVCLIARLYSRKAIALKSEGRRLFLCVIKVNPFTVNRNSN